MVSQGVSEERRLESVLGRPLERNDSRLGRTHYHEGALRRTHYEEETLMRNAIKSLAFVAAIAAAALISFPAEADAQHYYGHGYGKGYYGHGYGHGYGGYGYGGYGPYGSGASRYSDSGAVRIEVNPKQSREDIQVYVDEAHAGVVDNFDGFSQRLYLSPGKHEIEIRLDGYETLRLAILVSPGNTYHIRGEMKPLAA